MFKVEKAAAYSVENMCFAKKRCSGAVTCWVEYGGEIVFSSESVRSGPQACQIASI
jgi:hypothetical protein